MRQVDAEGVVVVLCNLFNDVVNVYSECGGRSSEHNY